MVDLNHSLHFYYKNLHEQGIGTSKTQADITKRLWKSGVLNSDTPEGLVNSVFYYNGINFVLRGGQEHRNLCLVQFSFRYETDLDIPDKMLEYVDYVEFGSKNCPGGRNLENKTVCQ